MSRQPSRQWAQIGWSMLAAALPGATLPGAVWAQGNQGPTPTPPTPLPKEAPTTEKYGIRPADVQPVRAFETQVPGQPLPGDPEVIRTLDQAIEVALRRSPAIELAQERAVRTVQVIQQILGTSSFPAVSVTGSYTRISGQGAAFGGGGAGINPAQIQNPFGVGLNYAAPGAIPVTLSSNTIGSVGATPPGGSAQSSGTAATAATTAPGVSGQTRSASAPSTRQTGGEDDGEDDGDNGGNNGGNNGNQGGFGGGGGTDLNQYSITASLSYLIDITGVVRAARQLARFEAALTRLEIVRQRMEVALNVKNAFYSLLRAQAFVGVNEAAVEQSRELLRVTLAQQQAGLAAEFDVLRARTQLANNEQALISSRNQVVIARTTLANTLGIDPTTPIQPAVPDIPPPPPLNEQALLALALDQRPEYAQADLNLLKAEKNVRLARRTMEPYLNAVASGTYNPNPAVFANQEATGSVGLRLTVPLTDGGATKAAVEAARSDERTARIQKDQFVRGIKAEVQQAIVAVNDAAERASAAEQTVAQAREALRLANVRYRAGAGTQLDVNDAQTALTQAETNFVNARYDYLGALARLARAVGSPVEGTRNP